MSEYRFNWQITCALCDLRLGTVSKKPAHLEFHCDECDEELPEDPDALDDDE